MYFNRSLKLIRVAGYGLQWCTGRPQFFYFPKNQHLNFFDLGPIRVSYPHKEN